MADEDMVITNDDSKRINASPTKEFFIYMLTRDIPLTRAILDLVDNSLDGARRMRSNNDYDGLWVRVTINKEHFKIVDNCGGIPVDIARNYAFRFGRPKDAPSTPGSIGEFGVGMKRTFFKLGRRFRIESNTMTSHFSIEEDVEQWLSMNETDNPDSWHFEFTDVDENLSNISVDKIGTHIEINHLYEAVSNSFLLDSFLTRLKEEMSIAYVMAMDKGLAISINGIPLTYEPAKLFVADILKPAFIQKSYSHEVLTGEVGAHVDVKLYAGIAVRDIRQGGWYVFCNGRLVLKADQSATTIWGQTHGMRQYHPDFAYFRGYAYIDSDDPGLLPWTTTKTGVDVDSAVYRKIQQEMIELSKPVITFLINLEKERAAFENGESTDQTLINSINTASAQRTDELPVASTFLAPSPSPIPAGPRMQRIQYHKPLDEVEKAKQLLKVHTFTAVGEKTFEYFMKYEEEE